MPTLNFQKPFYYQKPTPLASELVFENDQLLKGIELRQHSLNRLSNYLSELESQLALIFAASPDIIVFLDSESVIVKISDAAYTILGYTREELIGKSLWKFIASEDIETTKRKFQEIQTNKVLYFDQNGAFINHWVSKEGKKVKLVWRFSVCDEREQQTIGVATDISHFGTNEAYNLKLLHKVADLTTDGIVITDIQQTDNPIVYVNKAYEKITGYSKEELLGKNCRLMQTEDTKNSRALQTLKMSLAQGKGCDVLLQNVKKNGQIFYNHLVISSVIEANQLVNYIGMIRDVTDQIGVDFDWSPNTESGFCQITPE